MPPNPANIQVAVVESTAFFKVVGRADYNAAGQFHELVVELVRRGFDHVVIDLKECVTMDSTFLGVMARIVLPEEEGDDADAARYTPPQADLLNANSRVLGLLDGLGVGSMFRPISAEVPCTLLFEKATEGRPALSKEDLSKLAIAAHEHLCRINPDNIPKFKDVIQFFKEELDKIQAKRSDTSPDSD